MLDLITIGDKLKDLRISNSYSQEELSEILLVTRQAISRWEVGNSLPTIDNLIELSKLYKVSFENLLCLDDEVIIDDENIFNGHDRLFIVNSVIESKIKVILEDVFYQFSNNERMMVLKAIKEQKLKYDVNRLFAKLTIEEQKYILMKG